MHIALNTDKLPDASRGLDKQAARQNNACDLALTSLYPSPGLRQCHSGYDIRPVRTGHQHGMASMLVHRMYASRGYTTGTARQPLDDPNRVTLAAWRYDDVVATLTLGRDSPSGLLADTLYAPEVATLRRPHRVVCEVTRLAVDPDFSSPDLLIALFQAAHRHGKEFLDASDVVIEVNPRHVAYYRRLMGFKQIGELRHCPRVDAPAVLLHHDLKNLTFANDRSSISHRDPRPHRSACI